MCRVFHRAALACFVGYGLAATAIAAPITTAFTYQGQLKQNGVPMNGMVNAVFSLYDDAQAGYLLGTQNVNDLAVTNGLFSVTLNASGEFGSNPFSGQALWLAITVNGQLLSPRQRLSVAPEAAHALTADSVAGVSGSSLSGPNGTPPNMVEVLADGKVVIASVAGLDQQNPDFNAFGLGGNWLKQSFTAGRSGYLTAIGFGSLSGGLSATLSVRAGSDVFQPQLTSQPITVLEGFKVYSLDTPVYLTQGSVYTFDIHSPSMLTLQLTTNTYAGGTSISPLYDMAFQTYMTGSASFNAMGLALGKSQAAAKLDIGGIPGVDGIRFPDGTLQTTAAVPPTLPSPLWLTNNAHTYNANLATGNVGIGEVNPQNALVVGGLAGPGSDLAAGIHLGRDGNQNPHIELVGNSTLPYIDFNNASAGDFKARIALTDSGTRLTISAAFLRVTGLFENFSDGRFKKCVEDLQDALGKVKRLHGVSYEWDRDAHPEMQLSEGRQVGFIAQEVQKVLPEAVTSDEQGRKSVSYTSVIPLLVEAVKAQQATIEARDDEASALRREQDRLKAELDELKAAVRALQRTKTTQE